MFGFGFKNPSISNVGPIITGINVDFVSANGGESRIITGINLGSASVLVDSNPATVTANTATSVTFTVPASSVSATNGNSSVSTVIVSTTSGIATTTGIPGNSVWYLPAYFGVTGCGVWSAQSVTTSGGNITTVLDQTGGGHTMSVNSIAPAYSATGGGSGGMLPFWSCTGGTNDNSLKNASFPAITQPFEVIYAARHNSSLSTANAAPWGAGTLACDLWVNGSGVAQYANAPATNYVPITDNVDFWIDGYYNSASSLHSVNGGTPITSGNPGTAGSSGGPMHLGVGLGGYYWAGSLYCTFVYPAGLSNTARANFAAYFTAQGL